MSKERGFMPQFIPGIDLNRHFFQQVIMPLMQEHFPDLPYAAGIVGEGSDVMRYDNPQSTDHNWGPHMRIFLNEEDFSKKDDLSKMFSEKLPLEFMGYPTNFTKPDEDTYLVQTMKPTKKHPVNHMIQFYTIKSFFQHYIGFDPKKRLTFKEWLAIPQQALIEVSQGEIYYDKIGIEKYRQKFAYYPDDVWEYIYMVQWDKLADEVAYVGRSGEVGDELGSSLTAGHLVQNIMRLCFLMEKVYYPYVKWFGTAFSRLESANELTGPLIGVLHAQDWQEREDKLGIVYEIILRRHNELKITRPIHIDIGDYHGRPYKVLRADIVYKEIRKSLKNQKFAELRYELGAVDQFIAHTHINHVDYVYHHFKKFLGTMKTD